MLEGKISNLKQKPILEHIQYNNFLKNNRLACPIFINAFSNNSGLILLTLSLQSNYDTVII